MSLLHYNTLTDFFPIFDPGGIKQPANREKRLKLKKNAQSMFLTYKTSNKNAGHLNHKMFPKQPVYPYPYLNISSPVHMGY